MEDCSVEDCSVEDCSVEDCDLTHALLHVPLCALVLVAFESNWQGWLLYVFIIRTHVPDGR